MGSLGYPKTWIPYMQNTDCSQGFCSIYCPQWCYIYISPPPPPNKFLDENSGPSFSPLVIAIIGIFAIAFLLVTYYTLFYKYCINRQNEQLEENQNPSLNESATAGGLDDAMIKSITICKYKKEDGLVELTDCSVCLGEFLEDENVRLLPKCSHAFHVECIDTWLKSHSSCPLCRANIIVSIGVISVVSEDEQNARDLGRNNEEETMRGVLRGVPKSPLRLFTDLEQGHTVIEIKDEEGYRSLRRSVSMNDLYQGRLLVVDVLRMNEEDYDVGSSAGASNKFDKSKRIVRCIKSPVAMKRSFSSGRFFFGRQGSVQNMNIHHVV